MTTPTPETPKVPAPTIEIRALPIPDSGYPQTRYTNITATGPHGDGTYFLNADLEKEYRDHRTGEARRQPPHLTLTLDRPGEHHIDLYLEIPESASPQCLQYFARIDEEGHPKPPTAQERQTLFSITDRLSSEERFRLELQRRAVDLLEKTVADLERHLATVTDPSQQTAINGALDRIRPVLEKARTR